MADPAKDTTDLSKMPDPPMEKAGTQKDPAPEQPKGPAIAVGPPEIPPPGQPTLKDIPEPPLPFKDMPQIVAGNEYPFERDERVKIFAPGFDIDGKYGSIASNSFILRSVDCADGESRDYHVWDVDLDGRLEGLFQLPARMLIPVQKFMAILR